MDTKALMPLKAQVLDPDEHEAWFAGKLPRRLLAIPFGGPIPSRSHAKGVDLDGQTFTERTDIFGSNRALRQTRERLLDWSHAYRPPRGPYGDPTGVMSGVVLGKTVLDDEPDEYGWWVDQWFKRGESRLALVKRLVERGVQLFGSSQPMGKTAWNDDGEITLWPFYLETLTTAPQNTYSVLRPKAALDAIGGDPFYADISQSLRDLGSDLLSTPLGEGAAKSGRVHSTSDMAALKEAMSLYDQAADRLRAVIARQPEYTSEP